MTATQVTCSLTFVTSTKYSTIPQTWRDQVLLKNDKQQIRLFQSYIGYQIPIANRCRKLCSLTKRESISKGRDYHLAVYERGSRIKPLKLTNHRTLDSGQMDEIHKLTYKLGTWFKNLLFFTALCRSFVVVEYACAKPICEAVLKR